MLSRLRLIFVISLVALAGVFIAVLLLLPSGQDYPESHQAQIIHDGNEWILQYDISNNRDTDIEYIIHVNIDDAFFSDSTKVMPGKAYTYIHHINQQQLTEGKVTVTLYEDGRDEPVAQNTYYLDLN